MRLSNFTTSTWRIFVFSITWFITSTVRLNLRKRSFCIESDSGLRVPISVSANPELYYLTEPRSSVAVSANPELYYLTETRPSVPVSANPELYYLTETRPSVPVSANPELW
jgi:hypothetical protein